MICLIRKALILAHHLIGIPRVKSFFRCFIALKLCYLFREARLSLVITSSCGSLFTDKHYCFVGRKRPKICGILVCVLVFWVKGKGGMVEIVAT